MRYSQGYGMEYFATEDSSVTINSESLIRVWQKYFHCGDCITKIIPYAFKAHLCYKSGIGGELAKATHTAVP